MLDALMRHRAVALGVIPAALIVLVLALSPRVPAADGAAGPKRYGAVIDAGSTGSRIHVFLFHEVASPDGAAGATTLELLSSDFEQLKPGLSSFADDPRSAAASLKPLLDKALAVVPAAQHATTTLELRATAGLRFLPGDKADRILAAVRSLFASYPFAVGPASVSIMDGSDEGAFAWVTHNYLTGRMGGPPGGTVATVDLGGGSVQLAYALDPAAAAAAPPGYVRSMAGGGATYSVYVHSYLGYGLMAARAATLAATAAGTGASSAGHACVPKGHDGNYSYREEVLRAKGTAAGADGRRCAAIVDTIFGFGAPCPHAPCAFAGSWSGGGGAGATTYHVCSYFFDRAAQAGLMTDAGAASAQTTPRAFEAAAAAACKLDMAQVPAAYPTVEPADAPYLCADLTYAALLLRKGFSIAVDAPITLVKRIMYRGREVEASWPLGAAINSMNSAKA